MDLRLKTRDAVIKAVKNGYGPQVKKFMWEIFGDHARVSNLTLKQLPIILSFCEQIIEPQKLRIISGETDLKGSIIAYIAILENSDGMNLMRIKYKLKCPSTIDFNNWFKDKFLNGN